MAVCVLIKQFLGHYNGVIHSFGCLRFGHLVFMVAIATRNKKPLFHGMAN